MTAFLRSLSAIGLGLIYAFLLLPLVAVVGASLTAGEMMRLPPQGLSLKWFGRFLGSETFREALALSLQVAGTTVLVVVTVATLAALCHRALTRRLGAAFRVAMLLPLLLPELLTAIGLLFFLNHLGLGKTLPGLQIGHVVIAFPFAFLAIVAALEQVDPALEEASASLGASGFETFRRVVLPLVKSGMLTGGLFAFIVSFDMFTISLLLKPIGGNTLPLALFDFLTYDFDPTAAAAATLSVIFAFCGVVLIERLVGLRRAF
ncbi:ABC transporter permease [Falsiroseomonas tokyonensis]|uniref:ABC transporter permease n=1 Tax=Falsiroseomonas tokyonensis TaxID=430521 RepID=A0ABV7BXL5_9PROT|nr:ABC transporter permease subunit [Falsiroseomonas tokyonensis]MBU8539391.1 ABC transporter permease subunit [Falsiroseomonas tokyonensis]